MYGQSASGPESLNEFAMLHQFWKWLGKTEDDINRMPWKKFQDFCAYIELLSARENENAKGPKTPRRTAR